jgi:LysM repeat protein
MRSILQLPLMTPSAFLRQGLLTVLMLGLAASYASAQNYAVQGGYRGAPPPAGYMSQQPPAYQPQAIPPAYMQQGNAAQPQAPYYYYQQAPAPSRSTSTKSAPAPSPKASTTPSRKSTRSSVRTATPVMSASLPSSPRSSSVGTRAPVSSPTPAPSQPPAVDPFAPYGPYEYPDQAGGKPSQPASPSKQETPVSSDFQSAITADVADLWNNDRRQDQRLSNLEADVRSLSTRPTSSTAISSERYTVRYGDSLSEIAARNGTTVAALRSTNNLRSDVLLEGQQLTLPGSRRSTASTKTVAKASTNGSHTVQRGESLSQIASDYRISLASLQSANNIRNANSISVGQRLTIPGRSSKVSSSSRNYVSTTKKPKVKTYTPPKPEAAPVAVSAKPAKLTDEPVSRGIASYRVETGDTLESIASTFTTSSSELRRINSLENGYKPKQGDELFVPTQAPIAL